MEREFKDFDFAHPFFAMRSPINQEFLRKAYKSGMRRNAFVEGMWAISKKKKKSTKKLLENYEWLNEKYNFFDSEENKKVG